MKPRSNHFTEQEWAQAGKALLCISGLACVALATFQAQGALSFVLRCWVGLFGVLNVGVALWDSRRKSL